MKNILYVTNIEVPYRVKFFNEFSNHCNLTVLYGRKKSANRNAIWTKSEEAYYTSKYLRGIRFASEEVFSFGIFKYIFDKKYDIVIIGCYNSPTQMLAIFMMKLFRRSYILNLDGEMFLEGRGIKNRIKKFFLRGADKYIVAGEKTAASLQSVIKDKPIIPYYFSSMNSQEIKSNASASVESIRNGKVLVVGQYFPYKGLDVALEAAKLDRTVFYKFVGMGSRTQKFIDECGADKLENVEIIPFLQKKELEEEYKNCSLFVLPSRQECWGLVINEAASFGAPIVSTYGSGAAVELLSDEYPQYLAKAGDAQDLYKKIKLALSDENAEEYKNFLLSKTAIYSIEQNVKAYCQACDIDN